MSEGATTQPFGLLYAATPVPLLIQTTTKVLVEIRDRTYENQQHRASGLNLLVTAIILWNTRYLERAVAALRQTEDVPDQLLAHLSPLGWEHVNLTGDYIWSAERPVTESRDGFHPLRAAPDTARKAA